ncbi:MAG: response regulator [Elusimicrobia bacterium]|nr:response regulator [Elusimicrobiota bacterium]
MKPRIMLVDDEPDFQAAVRAWLEPDYECCALKDGAELIGALRAGAPDLVVLDLHLPGLGGLELCRLLRATPGLESLPVLFLTGSQDVGDYQKSFHAGGTAYLMKPVGRLQLLDAVESLLGESRAARPALDVGGGD